MEILHTALSKDKRKKKQKQQLQNLNWIDIRFPYDVQDNMLF